MIDTHTSTAQELADFTGLTARRIRQLAEEKKLLKVTRGRYDTSFAVNFLSGRNHLSDHQQKTIEPKVQAFVGWLAGCLIGNEIYRGDLHLAYSDHWGMTKDEALVAFIKAAALLGRKYDLNKLRLKLK